MEIDQLQAFHQLSKDKNYRVAAEHLFITQSALTKKIKRLENQMGVVLFERGRGGAELSQAGKVLLPDAIRMMTQFEEFQRLTQRVSKGTEGRLNIGFGISTYSVAPRFISEFKSQYPNVDITLNDMPSYSQVDALLSGDIQLSFNRIQHITPPLKSLTLFSDKLAIALPKNTIIDPNNIWQSLAQINYLQLNPSRGMGLNQQIQKYFSMENSFPPVIQESNDILTLLALVSAGLGYTIIPASAQIICQPNIKLIEILSPSACWDIGLIWNTENEDNLRLKFVDLVRKLSI
ncbi:LysR family transcriptional regulator [Vibrio sp. S11_S32]|uniref:LysR family transcriptional regulator n=1 Tax=Vibrio sp. S11_S32 TaxID=2720225 RepID=UPI00168061A8|nr:LysR family transcriptional regulator [Vibrio sp. S11_S32]MBD1577041.1 LysR family transcriptional regulator [Vibrio sp. S11_S32]